MRTSIRKWGNSLALRIPKPFADEAKLRPNSPVEISLVEGKLVVTPLAPSVPTLEELVAGITDENKHGEFDTGPAVGNEIWWE